MNGLHCDFFRIIDGFDFEFHDRALGVAGGSSREWRRRFAAAAMEQGIDMVGPSSVGDANGELRRRFVCGWAASVMGIGWDEQSRGPPMR
jgi:hypothetical protein